MTLRHVSLRIRLIAVMALVFVSLAALGVWGIVDHQVGAARIAKTFDDAESSAATVGKLREAIGNMRRLQSDLVALGSSNTVETDRMIGLWKNEVQAVRTALDAYAAADPSDSTAASLVADQQKHLDAYVKAMTPIAEQLKMAQIDGPVALAYAGTFEGTISALIKGSDTMLEARQAQQAARRTAMMDTAAFTGVLRLGIVGLALVIVLPLLWFTLRSVSRPLEEAVATANRIAEGDLGSRIDTRGSDETAALMQALARMQSSLRQLVAEVRSASQSIDLASSEVATGNLDLSQRTEQAAGQLQATASSVEQLHTAVTSSADTARQANAMARDASEAAQRGGEVVSNVVSTIGQISESSRQIGEIVGTIDSIAFQTNILALNAAVEAARAGEHGRGFAVVASEVRQLAQNSAEAARKVKQLVSASVERVEDGTRLASQAGSAMDAIVNGIRNVDRMIAGITTAAGEQSSGLGQVNAAVADLDRATQQNAALVEESAAAADSLKAQANRLVSVISRFRGVEQTV
jgi:methyl-accepting chemotaxis protein